MLLKKGEDTLFSEDKKSARLIAVCKRTFNLVFTGFHVRLLCFYINSFTEKPQQCLSTFYYSKYFNEDT